LQSKKSCIIDRYIKGQCHEISQEIFAAQGAQGSHYLKPVLTTPAVLVAKFAAGVVDTGGKFATGVVDTGGAPLLENISAKF
jgi:hypothetical protein